MNYVTPVARTTTTTVARTAGLNPSRCDRPPHVHRHGHRHGRNPRSDGTVTFKQAPRPSARTWRARATRPDARPRRSTPGITLLGRIGCLEWHPAVLDDTSSGLAQAVGPKTIAGSFTVASRVFDAPECSGHRVAFVTGIVGIRRVSLTGGTATFADKNVGAGKTVTGTGFSLTRAQAGNYTLASSTLTTTATISAATLAVSFTANSKVYDGGTDCHDRDPFPQRCPRLRRRDSRRRQRLVRGLECRQRRRHRYELRPRRRGCWQLPHLAHPLTTTLQLSRRSR